MCIVCRIVFQCSELVTRETFLTLLPYTLWWNDWKIEKYVESESHFVIGSHWCLQTNSATQSGEVSAASYLRILLTVFSFSRRLRARMLNIDLRSWSGPQEREEEERPLFGSVQTWSKQTQNLLQVALNPGDDVFLYVLYYLQYVHLLSTIIKCKKKKKKCSSLDVH